MGVGGREVLCTPETSMPEDVRAQIECVGAVKTYRDEIAAQDDLHDEVCCLCGRFCSGG